MLESLKPRAGKRWPRGQRFVISPAGTEAEQAYRDAVQACRAQGRGALESAGQAWALPLRVQPADGVVLAELRPGKKSIADVTRSLDECGTTPAEVKAAIDRLAEAGLIAPAPHAGEGAPL